MIPERLLRAKTKAETPRSNLAVAYLRVSFDDQVYGESLDVQKQKIEAYAEEKGLEIVKWFIDEGKSGKTVKKREAVKDMLTYLARNKGKVGYAVFYKIQRSSRDLISYAAELKSILMSLGVAVRSATELIDETPQGRFMEGMFVLNGQLDNDVKASIVKDNMASLAKQGWWQGSIPPGYAVEKVKINAKKSRSKLCRAKSWQSVRELFELYSTGSYTKADIVRIAKEKGVRGTQGGFLNDTSVDRMLSQPAYMGYVCNKHTDYELYEGLHIGQAIVTPELFDKVQVILAQQSRSKNKIGKPKQFVNPLYPLKHTLLCDNCGKAYRASAPLSGGGKSHSARYHCPSKQCAGIVKSRKADLVHEDFVKLLEHITPSDGILKLYKEILNRQALVQLGQLNKRLDTQRKRLTELDNERLTALRNANSGTLSMAEKDELVAGLEAEKLGLLETISGLEEQQLAKQSSIEYALNFMHDVKKLWSDADPELKLRFQKMMFPEGVSYDTSTLSFGTQALSPLYRYAPNKKDLSVSEKSLLVTSRRIELRLPG